MAIVRKAPEPKKTQVQAPSERQRRKKRRKKRSKAFFVILFVLLMLAVVITSITLFFDVKEIKVEGESIYINEEIIAASGIELEDNMFALNKFSICDKIENLLPFVEEAVIERNLPNTIIIKITQAKQAAYLETTGGYVLLSSKGKVLANKNEKPETSMQLFGSGIVANTVGEIPQFKDNITYEMYLALMEQFESFGITEKVTMLNIGRASRLAFEYEGCIVVNLGTNENLTRKFEFFRYIMDRNPKPQFALMDLTETVSNKATYSGDIPQSKYLTERGLLITDALPSDENEEISSDLPEENVSSEISE
ncbi:MAG: FtsQ-type POTRA domain-containing protein [Ruminococcaceae bacterium]|nr:FtsQ-type POTRA domain-containing protein [Oscillospiraceae bacterium]